VSEEITLDTKEKREEFFKFALAHWRGAEDDPKSELKGPEVTIGDKLYIFDHENLAYKICYHIDELLAWIDGLI
jgi:hypothetical protein